MILNILIAAFTSLFTLSSKSFLIDEIFSVQFAHSNQFLNTMWFREFNMWLYYVLLHFWLLLGKSEFIVRLPSAIFAVAAIPFIFKTTEYIYDKRVARLATFLTAINLLFVFYAQEARSYSLALLLSSASTYLFVRLVLNKNKENYLLSFLYLLTSSLSVYAHVYSFLIIVAQGASLLFLPLRKYLKTIIVWMFLICLLISPLIISPSFHSNQINWIPKPPITSIIGTYYILSGDFAPLFVLYIFVILAFFPWRNFNKWKTIFIPMLLTIPVITAFLFSISIKPIYLSKYFIVLLPYLMALVSMCFYRIRTKWLFKVVVILSILLSAVRLSFWYTKIDVPGFTISNNNPDWRSSTNYLAANSRIGDCAIFFTYIGIDDFKFYHTSPSPIPIEIASKPYTFNNGVELNIPEPDFKKLSGLSCSTIWLVLNNHANEGENRARHEKIEETLHIKYRLTKNVEFYQMQIEEWAINK